MAESSLYNPTITNIQDIIQTYLTYQKRKQIKINQKQNKTKQNQNQENVVHMQENNPEITQLLYYRQLLKLRLMP